ncbi:MAG: hypothetical protein J5752_04420 [Clostridiales bacterium]|nr:hypothetical protein [Clostridiales bacterium]
MATLCKNCGHALVYDPAVKKMHCGVCGATFEAEEVESEAKKFRENERVMTRGEVYGEDEEVQEEFLECYVYTCGECGGEIVIHGSEVSTKCVYCGNPTVVFSRVAQEKTPDFVIPFAITRDQAVDLIHQKIAHSILVPKEIKNFQAEDVRGIYLPYWIVNANHEETCVVRSVVKSGKYSTTRHWGRTGKMVIRNFPMDGSKLLSNESSARLEPFDFKDVKIFDEDYLLGFYSNASDIDYDELHSETEKRAMEIFEEKAMADVKGSSKKIMAQMHETAILNDYSYAMFPVWFVTFTYEGKHNTILVNGQTGKVVCGLPWRKTLFWTFTIVAGLLITIVAFFLFKGLFYGIFELGSSRKSSSNDSSGKLVVAIAAGIVALFSAGVTKMKKVLKQIKLTQSSKTFNFVKKRQE